MTIEVQLSSCAPTEGSLQSAISATPVQRSDGVVAWQTCRHIEQSDLVQDIEIEGSHLGM